MAARRATTQDDQQLKYRNVDRAMAAPAGAVNTATEVEEMAADVRGTATEVGTTTAPASAVGVGGGTAEAVLHTVLRMLIEGGTVPAEEAAL